MSSLFSKIMLLLSLLLLLLVGCRAPVWELEELERTCFKGYNDVGLWKYNTEREGWLLLRYDYRICGGRTSGTSLNHLVNSVVLTDEFGVRIEKNLIYMGSDWFLAAHDIDAGVYSIELIGKETRHSLDFQLVKPSEFWKFSVAYDEVGFSSSEVPLVFGISSSEDAAIVGRNSGSFMQISSDGAYILNDELENGSDYKVTVDQEGAYFANKESVSYWDGASMELVLAGASSVRMIPKTDSSASTYYYLQYSKANSETIHSIVKMAGNGQVEEVFEGHDAILGAYSGDSLYYISAESNFFSSSDPEMQVRLDLSEVGNVKPIEDRSWIYQLVSTGEYITVVSDNKLIVFMASGSLVFQKDITSSSHLMSDLLWMESGEGFEIVDMTGQGEQLHSICRTFNSSYPAKFVQDQDLRSYVVQLCDRENDRFVVEIMGKGGGMQFGFEIEGHQPETDVQPSVDAYILDGNLQLKWAYTNFGELSVFNLSFPLPSNFLHK